MSSPEIIDISELDSGHSININNSIDDINEIGGGNGKASNFGIELLMNDRKKSSGGSRSRAASDDIGLGDLNNLEDELNELSMPKKSMKSARSDMFSGSFKLNEDNDDIDIDDVGINISEPLHLGSSMKEQSGDESKTWDGYGKFNDIPINPDVTKRHVEPKMSAEETLREKFSILQKLEDLERKGVKLTKKYDMESNLLEMKGEYESVIAEKEKKNGVKFQGKMLMACITGLEFLNNKFDPFDVRLDGWSEQINENIDDYDEIFAELHE